MFASRARQEAGVYLTFLVGDFADTPHERLQAERAAIESELGIPIEWTSKEGRHRITDVPLVRRRMERDEEGGHQGLPGRRAESLREYVSTQTAQVCGGNRVALKSDGSDAEHHGTRFG